MAAKEIFSRKGILVFILQQELLCRFEQDCGLSFQFDGIPLKINISSFKLLNVLFPETLKCKKRECSFVCRDLLGLKKGS